MRKSLFVIAAAGAVAFAAPALAHHSFGMFDGDKMYIWEGTVVEYSWKNPHSEVVVDIPANAKDPATVGRWTLEGAAPNIMARQGWNKASYKPGDHIVIVGQPARNGDKFGSIYYALKDGKRLYHDVNRKGGPGSQGKGVPAGVVLP